jgi:hypothetical protein
VDFQPGLSGTILLSTGELDITRDVTITGPGSSMLTVSGNHASRIFDVSAAVTAVISGLTVAHGIGSLGGGIENNGTLIITSMILTGNTSVGSFVDQGEGGGAIFNSGTLRGIQPRRQPARLGQLRGRCSAPSELKVWDVQTGHELFTVINTNSVSRVAFKSLRSQGGSVHEGGTANEDEARQAIAVTRQIVQVMNAIPVPAAPAPAVNPDVSPPPAPPPPAPEVAQPPEPSQAPAAEPGPAPRASQTAEEKGQVV